MSVLPIQSPHRTHTSITRRDGRLVIEIPEARVLALVAELFGPRAVITQPDRLLDHVAAGLARPGRSGRERGELPVERLLGDLVAEAAHARAGIRWSDPEQHLLIHE